MAQYNQVTPEIIEQLKLAAPDHVFTGADINEDYMRDEMPIYGKKMPDVLIQPLTTEEISAVMKICNENLIPVTPRGAGTGLVGASVAMLGGVMIDTQKMNQILEYDLDNMIVRVQPGVLLNDLAVPTGEVVDFGAQVSKTSTGYSLLNLMIGSEGTLGIITELTLKIIPAPKVVVSLVVPFLDLETAIATVPKIKNAQLDPQALEFMEREIVLSSERFIGKSTFPKEMDGQEVGAYLLITFDGKTEDEVMAKVEECCELVLSAGAIDVLVADSPTKIRDAWAARSGFLEAIEAETKLLDECDVVVPITKIAEFLNFANAYGKECGLEIKSFGHAGDGNLHIYQCSNDLEEEEFKKRVDKYFNVLYKQATAIGGLVSGEHGIGRGKIKYLRECIGETSVNLMYGIKKVFDPNLILNPGKVCYPLE